MRAIEEDSMGTVEAIFASGVFKPLGPVALPENQRVRLSIEAADASDLTPWLEAVRAFQQQLVAHHGVLPDSTADIAADRRRHE
jgi:predicted DNA-binding antitoxin AbrB/MazE fold protein